ncbi:Uncharacterised protein [Klebsiella pneumoniae]|uniref:Uncharacterized protein n=1 Tax=Klebsiella pneumoniae TaxID=573 RepID=A0A377ZZM8_KLEPN|nr:Uncharacterised protein [Klebsiella pneumoniae]
MELDGSSGEMVYGYLLDFTDYASPEIAQKILRRHSSLRIEVGPGFIEVFAATTGLADDVVKRIPIWDALLGHSPRPG